MEAIFEKQKKLNKKSNFTNWMNFRFILLVILFQMVFLGLFSN